MLTMQNNIFHAKKIKNHKEKIEINFFTVRITFFLIYVDTLKKK